MSMTLKQAIKEADRVCVSVYMNPGYAYQVKISKKEARIVAADYLDRTIKPGLAVRDRLERIVANYDITPGTRFKMLYLGCAS